MSHTPGPGHRRKSDPATKRRYQKRSAKKKEEADKEYDEAVQERQAILQTLENEKT
jgi:hypothetical protein